jgi:hypothetical protein
MDTTEGSLSMRVFAPLSGRSLHMEEGYRAAQDENSLTGRGIGVAETASAQEREGAHDPEQQDTDRGEQQGAAGDGLFHDRVVSWGQHGLGIPIGSDP